MERVIMTTKVKQNLNENVNENSLIKYIINNPNFSVIVAFIILSIILSLITDSFLTVQNISNLLIQTTTNFVLAIGVMFIIITGGTDLSIGRIAGFTGAILAIVFVKTGNPWLGLISAILTGILAGTFNGLVVSKLKIAPFVATLGTQTILQGLTLIVTDSKPISGMHPIINKIGVGRVLGIPVLVIIAIIVYFISAFILKYTKFGRVLYGIGGNEEATRLSGINVDKNKLMAYVWGGLMAGLAGIMLTARLNSAQPTAGAGYELEAIAAAVIGGTSFSGGIGTATGTLFGALLLSTIRNGMNLLSIPTNWQYVVIGIVIIGAVFLDTIRNKDK